jgi:membrane-associated phospholipid phosphatase
MRISEWIQGGFAVLFCLAAWTTAFTSRPLPARRRWIVTGLAAFAVGSIALAQACRGLMSKEHFLVLLDLMTMVLFLVPYWQTGQFFVAQNQKIQGRLLKFDQWLLPRASQMSGTERNSVGLVLEMAYLSCYPLVPLGVLAIYAKGLQNRIDGFWLVLLVATYLCYAITPLVPALPPRSLIDRESTSPAYLVRANKGRLLNRWILRHGSIHAISFPSAHVASAFAIALVFLYYAPMVGMIFLAIAIMISLGAVIGRYHYALDVLAGGATALVVFILTYRYF